MKAGLNALRKKLIRVLGAMEVRIVVISTWIFQEHQ